VPAVKRGTLSFESQKESFYGNAAKRSEHELDQAVADLISF